MKMLKDIDAETGLALVAEARAKASDPDWFAATTEAYPPNAIPRFAGRRPTAAREVDGTITDLIVVYEFDDQTSLVGKFLLPVVKTRPWLGFAGLDDRGFGLDIRMSLFAAESTREGVEVPAALHYDSNVRVLWQEHVEGLRPFTQNDWRYALEPLGRALGRGHGTIIPPELVDRVENPLFRDYLIAYPLRQLQPFLAEDEPARCWRDFLARDTASPRALIHGDLKPGNLCLKKTKLYVLDFERSNLANAAYDLGCLICHLLVEVWDEWRDDEDCARLLIAFLSAYESTAPDHPQLDRCVAGYLSLFLAYRMATSDLLFLRNPETTRLLEPALRCVFAHWGAPVSELVTLLVALPAAADFGRSAK